MAEVASHAMAQAATAGRRKDERLIAAAAAAGVALAAVAVAVVLASEQPGDQRLVALASILAVAVPVAVGLNVWRDAGAYVAFGRILVGWGLLNFLPVLSFSSDPTLYSLGRLGVWVVMPAAIAAILAFPWGRLLGTGERGIVIALAATVAVLFLPTALIVDRYPEPSFWVTCYGDCPRNAFMVLETEPAFIDDWIRPLRELITVTAYLATVGLLALRLRAATLLGRRMIAPVLVVAIVHSLTLAAGFPLRRTDPTSAAVDVVAWILMLSLPALALAFAVGIVRSRLLAGAALRRLALGLRVQRGERDVRDVLSATIEDPTLEIAYWIPDRAGRWVDGRGKDVQLPVDRSKRWVTEVREGDWRVAAIVHDPALRDQQSFVEAAGAFALTALENQRLKVQVDASLDSLREWRARSEAAANSERRRIERDLHDGAQQRLLALRVRLELAAETVGDDPARAPTLLREMGREVEEALDDVRSLAHGIYPALLADRGLGDALRDAARRAPLRATVEIEGVERYPGQIEAAVYFCCIEALQNSSKHTPEDTSVVISVAGEGVLRFDVRDDGPGFDLASAARGTGLTSMRDRIRAVGGALTITSRPGAGTHVAGFVPLP